MKPTINLRLCVAGNEILLEQFEKCLKSYLKYFNIEELLIYTTDNLFSKVNLILESCFKEIDEISIYDVDKFYQENQNKFPESVTQVLDYSKNKKFKSDYSMFYLRMRLVMDYYLVGEKPFIFSDIDIRIYDNIKPIVDWIDSDYILYSADSCDEYYFHSEKIKNSVGEDFFKSLPQFNNGWICIPKNIKIDIKEVFQRMIQDIDSCPGEMAAVAITLIKNKVKTKLLPRGLMVTQNSGKRNKTLAHLGPYGLE